jgi:hypothetical protein
MNGTIGSDEASLARPLSNNGEVAPAALVQVKKERSKKASGAGTTAWTEQECLLASRSWIKTSTEMMGIKANLADFDRKWAEYYNQMKDAQEVIETQVCILFYFIETLKKLISDRLCYFLFNSLSQRKRQTRNTSNGFYKRLRREHSRRTLTQR